MLNSPTPTDQPKRNVWPMVAALVLLLPVLYVASYGLLLWLDIRGLLPDWAREIHRGMAIPLWWASHRFPVVDRLLVRYIELFH